MEPRLVRDILRSLLLALAFSAATYLLVWELGATHQETEVTSGAAFPVALWMFPAFFFGTLVVILIRHSGARRH